jgi:hypothetical protein
MLYSIGVDIDQIDKIETSVPRLCLSNTGPLPQVLAKDNITLQIARNQVVHGIITREIIPSAK